MKVYPVTYTDYITVVELKAELIPVLAPVAPVQPVLPVQGCFSGEPWFQALKGFEAHLYLLELTVQLASSSQLKRSILQLYS